MTYSFCTICKGRLHTLRRVFKENLSLAKPGMEFVILDYGSEDGLGEWVKENAQKYIDEGALIYGKIRRKYLNLSHAKNLAHVLANGRVLVNLDADNFLTPEYIVLLEETFRTGVGVSLLHSNSFDSVTGRIAISAEVFYSLRGYNESFKFYGYEDIDLVERANAAGVRVVTVDGTKWGAIDNTLIEKWAHFKTNVIDTHSYEKNQKISLVNLTKRLYTGNGLNWAKGRVRVNFKSWREL